MARPSRPYPWLLRAFGDHPFTVRRFEATFPASRAYRTLSELRVGGYAERVGRATYRARPPHEWLAAGTTQVTEVEAALSSAELEFAFDGPTAVALWTSGRYLASSAAGFQPPHIVVRKKEAARWVSFLRSRGDRLRPPGVGGRARWRPRHPSDHRAPRDHGPRRKTRGLPALHPRLHPAGRIHLRAGTAVARPWMTRHPAGRSRPSRRCENSSSVRDRPFPRLMRGAPVGPP